MTHRLPYDYVRCTGLHDREKCDARDDCLRYIMRNDLGPRTPIMNAPTADHNQCESFINQWWSA